MIHRRYFTSIKQALPYLELDSPVDKEINCEDGLITCLKFFDNSRTYHKFHNKERIIYFVGYAVRQNNGHPVSNHIFYNQHMFLKSWKLQIRIPVIKELKTGEIVLLGYYKIDDYEKRVSNEGFSYFVFKLMRT